MPTPDTLDQPLTFESRLCDDSCVPLLETTDGNFCFQLPTFTTGSELLALANTEIGFAVGNSAAAGYNSTVDTTGGTCPGSPTTANNSFSPACVIPGTLSGTGDWFVEIKLGDVTIDYALNPDDDTSGEVLLRSIDGVETSDYAITETDANTDILYLTTNGWNNGDQPELKVRAKQECDGTNLREKWDITVDEYNWIPSFYEATFTATDDTFYKLEFDLNKTSSVTVTVTESDSDVIISDTETGPSYSEIFKTGTLPVDKTITVRWVISDLAEYPNANYNSSVLTNVTLYKVCQYTMDIKDSSDVLQSSLGINFVETHDTTTIATGVVYNENIQYCIDLSLLSADTYRFVATDSCDATTYDSNKWQICAADCDYNTKISWDHGNVKFIGEHKLDYFNYTYTPFFRARVDLQDLTQEWERLDYIDAAGYLQNPWTYYRNVLIMQVSSVPGYMRRAVALALSDVFMLDGVEYRKLDDDDLAPLFAATDPNAIRVLVTKVGDFLQNRTA